MKKAIEYFESHIIEEKLDIQNEDSKENFDASFEVDEKISQDDL